MKTNKSLYPAVLLLFCITANAEPGLRERSVIQINLPFVNVFDPESIKVPRLQVGEDTYNLDIETNLSWGLVRLRTAEQAPEEEGHNPLASFDPNTYKLSLFQVEFGAETYWLEADVVDNGTSIDFTGINYGLTRDFSSHLEYTADYDNSFPDDAVMVKEDGTLSWGSYNGVWKSLSPFGPIEVSLEDGATVFLLDYVTPTLNQGSGDHLGESNVGFELKPNNLPTEIELPDGTIVKVIEFVPTGMGSFDSVPALGYQLTDNSAAFSFSNGDDFELNVRVADRCETDDSLRVFASMIGGVDAEYEINIRNPQTEEEVTLSNPVAAGGQYVEDRQFSLTCELKF